MKWHTISIHGCCGKMRYYLDGHKVSRRVFNRMFPGYFLPEEIKENWFSIKINAGDKIAYTEGGDTLGKES